MITQNNTFCSSLFILLFIFLFTHNVRIQIPRCADAGKDHISDDLDYVSDDEEMKKPQIGPVVGFVKLGVDFPRSPDALFKMAVKWADLLLTGGIEVKFSGVNLGTMMFAVRSAGDVDEVKDFLLEQPEVYEIKIGEQIYGRPGNPTVEEILEKLSKEKENANGAISDNDMKVEL